MAPRKTNSTKNTDDGPSSHSNKRGRNPDFDKLLHLRDGYMTHISPEVHSLIHGWECEVREINANQESPRGDWEVIMDPGTTRGRNMLFNKTLQFYWIINMLLVGLWR